MESKHAKSGRMSRAHKKKAATVSSMSDCLLPHDLIYFSILTRLPVISLIRFKTVCKPFKNLISTPKFITLHRLQTATTDLNNNSLIIHTIIRDDEGESSSFSYNSSAHLISLVKVDNVASETNIISLVHPFPLEFDKMSVVGSINGIVCLACPPLCHMIVLWNPAINQWKPVRLSNNNLGNGDPDLVYYLAVCFDSETNDLKVVRVVIPISMGNPHWYKDGRFQAEIYSSTKDSWKLISLDFLFVFLSHRYWIVKGDPIWPSYVNEMELSYIKFDGKTERFEQLPYHPHENYRGCLVEWKDSLAHIGVSCVENSADIVELWMYDEGVSNWSKKFTLGPIGMDVRKILHYRDNGHILGVKPNNELILFDHKSNSTRELLIKWAADRVFPYTESLVRFKGMKPVKKKDMDDSWDTLLNYEANIKKFRRMNLLVNTNL